jgi:hypothetical protein
MKGQWEIVIGVYFTIKIQVVPLEIPVFVAPKRQKSKQT